MKNMRAILMLLIALVAGVAAVVSASRWLVQHRLRPDPMCAWAGLSATRTPALIPLAGDGTATGHAGMATVMVTAAGTTESI